MTLYVFVLLPITSPATALTVAETFHFRSNSGKSRQVYAKKRKLDDITPDGDPGNFVPIPEEPAAKKGKKVHPLILPQSNFKREEDYVATSPKDQLVRPLVRLSFPFLYKTLFDSCV